MSTRTLAAAARPSNVIPFPSSRSRRVVPGPADFDPFDHDLALAERNLRAQLLADGESPRFADAFVADLLARCDVIIANEFPGGAR